MGDEKKNEDCEERHIGNPIATLFIMIVIVLCLGLCIKIFPLIKTLFTLLISVLRG